MDSRDVVAATLAAAVFQTLNPPVKGAGGPPQLIRTARETAIQVAVLLYQEVLAALPPEMSATDQASY